MAKSETPKGKRPDYTVYFIQDREGCPWTTIGAAWSHNDGEGFNLKLDLLPNVAGRIVLRTIKAEGTEGGQ